MALMSLPQPDGLTAQLADLAEATGGSKTFLPIQAIREFAALQSWQMAEIKKDMAEADAGDFATEEEPGAIKEKIKGLAMRIK